jgi:hypothetical protein
MELGRYAIPFAVFNLAEAGYIYPTWSLMVAWLLYDTPVYWRKRDTLMVGHHVVTLFILCWLMLFEGDANLLKWISVAGLMELSGCSTVIYCNLSSRGYWDKMAVLSVYAPLRFWYVPRSLMELGSVGACHVPLALVWLIVALSAWWIRRIFFNALLGTMIRIHTPNFNLIQY